MALIEEKKAKEFLEIVLLNPINKKHDYLEKKVDELNIKLATLSKDIKLIMKMIENKKTK